MSLNINILLILKCLQYRLKFTNIDKNVTGVKKYRCQLMQNTNVYRYFGKQNCQSVASTREQQQKVAELFIYILLRITLINGPAKGLT